ncbi:MULTISPECIES: hypothetical protein [Methanobacterium]|jgi:hypothetical protein|uniref:Uncharacterized protein n=1 Tax=Methanobacterium veterum TaxID=408577 RepID=A0A9E4ZXC4_9EURY|nr:MULTISPECIES: hypothetical protein [Methanobacterium]MCZ3367297.1 hypothetical protein [Methanobacterium veterum]MCZ3373555.1 hypothetical protein [Methanobacterium veterum]
METIAVILMVILFLVLMVFVFSTALLTPIIGKKNLIFVVLMGFIVGIIGGAFFISPIMDDIPNIASAFYQSTSTDLDTIYLDIPDSVDVNQFINTAKNIDGVKNVNVTGITIKTSSFSDYWKNTLPDRIPASNTNITSVQIQGNDTLNIQIQNGSNAKDTIKSLDDWLMLIAGISSSYSAVHVTVQADPSKTDQVRDQLSQTVVVTSIEGPTQDKINSLKAILPNQSNVIILCGFIGMFVGLAGVFIDSILGIFENIKGRVVKK